MAIKLEGGGVGLISGFFCGFPKVHVITYVNTIYSLAVLIESFPLLQAASNLMVIKQRPKERLQMRGTIHTGSVIAGVQVAK